MRRTALLLLMPGVAALAGCPLGPTDMGGTGGLSPPTGGPVMPGGRRARDPNAQPGKSPNYKLVVTLRLTTIEVPVGTVSGSEEVWSYLDEEPIKAIRSANLGRNGLRVGLGQADSWPDLARVLRRMTGQSPKQHMVATIPGDPLPIVLKERQRAQTVFTFHNDRTLSGRDYPPGDYVLATVCTLDADDLSKVLITAMPQVRSTRRRTRFVLGETGPEMFAHADVHGFDALTFQLTVPSKSFLVIGPGVASRNPTSVGHHFLIKKREGMEFEMLLVLVPEVLATPMR